jgi:hypothetical protein
MTQVDDAALKGALAQIGRTPGWCAVDAIARLANIPPDKLRKFSSEAFFMLVGAWQSSEFRLRAHERREDTLVRKAETHIRAAYDAMRAFTPHQQDIFEKAFLVACSYEGFDVEFEDVQNVSSPGVAMLEGMVAALACITGKNPTFGSSEGGRRKKTFKDWQFRKLVGLLWQTVRKYGGELSFSCKQNRGSGTMVDALSILRPLLPRLIPPVLDQRAKTIERVKRSLNTETYEGFGYVMSVRSGLDRVPF